jgi:hypothetical protein
MVDCHVVLRPPEPSPRDEMLRAARDLEDQGRWEEAMRIRFEVAESWPAPGWTHLRLPWAWHWDRRQWPREWMTPRPMNLIRIVRARAVTRSLGGCDPKIPDDSAARIVGYSETSVWSGQGEVAGMMLLDDGRFVAWEIGKVEGAKVLLEDGRLIAQECDVAIARMPGASLEWLSARGRELIRWG